MVVMSAREWDDIRAERKLLQDRIATAELELGGLRTMNVQLHRDNSQLAHQLELVIVQLAVANDERVALLRARGVAVLDTPQFEVARPGEAPKATPAAWVGRPLEDEAEEEKARTVSAMESSAAASLFDDPGDAAAAVLGRAHNELGEVEYRDN